MQKSTHIYVYHSTNFPQLTHHHLIWQQNITHTQKLLSCPLPNLPTLLPSTKISTILTLLSLDLWTCFWILCKWTHITCMLLCLASFFNNRFVEKTPMLLHVALNCLFSLLDCIPFDDYSWLPNPFYCWLHWVVSSLGLLEIAQLYILQSLGDHMYQFLLGKHLGI